MNKLKTLSGMAVSVLLVLSLLTNYIIVSAAEETTPERNIILGTDHIEGGQVSKIYLGKYPQTDNGTVQPAGAEGVDWVKVGENPLNWCGPYFNIDPIKWRVLKTENSTALLLSDQNLDGIPYHTEEESVTWEKSTIRSWLNGYGKDSNIGGTDGIDYSDNSFKGMAFSVSEWSRIVETAVLNSNNHYYGTSGGNDTKDKIFLLSIGEVENIDYGFTDDDSRYTSNPAYWGHRAGSSTTQRLRSSGRYEFSSATIGWSGWVDAYGAYVTESYIGIRPALNLDISSVLFTSGKGAYALTFKDSSREFAVSDKTAKTVIQGENLSFDYTGAKVLGGEHGNEYISAVLVNDNNEVLNYTQITKAVSENGTAVYTVPEETEAGEYTLMLFNEQYNGEKKISFSSDLTTNSIPLTVIPKDFKITALGEDCKSVTVEIPAAGKYSLVFADYEDGILNSLDVITKDFAIGKTTVSSDEEINLSTGDKVMLWQDMSGIEPLCGVLTVE